MISVIRRVCPVFLLSAHLLWTGFMLMGCGYQFRATGETIGIELESISIPMMTSTSSDRGFEADFTRIIREEFISHARIPLVSSEGAQTVLIGHVYDIGTSPLTYDVQKLTLGENTPTFEITDSRRLKIGLDIKLMDQSKGHVIWSEANMEEKASFKIGSDPLVNRFNQKQALERIARRLAKRIYLKTMERF